MHGDDLVIATHGRGFYILDDIAPLREQAAGAAPGARLYAPAVAIRARPVPFTGTPKPKDEPMAANPADGAYLDYVVPAGAAGPVTLAIHAPDGSPVRVFASTDPAPPAPDLARIDTAPEWIPPHAVLSAAPGEHRFVWDLRYAAPDGHGPGVWAPPGRYTVTLTVAGQTFTQTVEVDPDPRVKLAAGAYGREFALARQIEAERTRAGSALAETQKLHGALAKAEAAAAPADKKTLAALDAELVQIAALRPEDARPGVAMPPRPVGALSELAGAFERLYAATDDADADPSPDVVSGARQASTALDEALRRWGDLKPRILAALKGR